MAWLELELCPNCVQGPRHGGAYVKLYKCKRCGKIFCGNCGSEGGIKCPGCYGDQREETGKVWKK